MVVDSQGKTKPTDLSVGPRVLLVDDDPDMISELLDGLHSVGIAAATANKATEALHLLDSNESIDVVVTDLQMPGIDGIELLKKISLRYRSRKLQTIIVTGHASLDRAVAALRLQAVDFIQKPLSVDELENALRRAFSSLEKERNVASITSIDPEYIFKHELAARVNREVVFRNRIFSDPAWDMLLHIAQSQSKQENLSVKDLCMLSRTSVSTAMRRIADLELDGLIERIQDPVDKRRTLVALTDLGKMKLDEFIARQSGRKFDDSLDGSRVSR